MCWAARHAHDTTADGDADNGLLSPRKLKNKRKRHHSMLKLWPHEPEPFLEETGSPFSFLYKSHVRTPPPSSVARALQTRMSAARCLRPPCPYRRSPVSPSPDSLFVRPHSLPLLSAPPLMRMLRCTTSLLTPFGACSLPLVPARSLPRSPGRNQSVRSRWLCIAWPATSHVPRD